MVHPCHSAAGCWHVGASRVFDGDQAFSEASTLGSFERLQQNCSIIHAPCPGPRCRDCGSPCVHAGSVLIAVDGACRGNGRSDAAAACAVFFSEKSPYNETHVLVGDDHPPMTSQRAELVGGIKALEAAERLADHVEEAGLEGLKQVVVKADSAYLVRGATEWVEKWKRRGWTNAKGRPVVNQDLFWQLEDRIQGLEYMGILVQFLHVLRGQNRDADAAANRALDESARQTQSTVQRMIGTTLIDPSSTVDAWEHPRKGGAQQTIDVLALDGLTWFDELYGGLLGALDGHAHVRRISTARTALKHLTGGARPAAVLVVDAGITKEGRREVLGKLAEYVAAGGAAIFCCSFSFFVTYSALKDTFSRFGLSWKAGSYTRSMLRVNPAATTALPSKRYLASTCTQKALHLVGVGYHHALYLCDDLGCRNQTPTAWETVGKGRIGYVGDVSAEKEANEVILAMSGV